MHILGQITGHAWADQEAGTAIGQALAVVPRGDDQNHKRAAGLL